MHGCVNTSVLNKKVKQLWYPTPFPFRYRSPQVVERMRRSHQANMITSHLMSVGPIRGREKMEQVTVRRLGHMTMRTGYMTTRIGHMTTRPAHMTTRTRWSPAHMTTRMGHMTTRPAHMTLRTRWSPAHMTMRMGHMTTRPGPAHMTTIPAHMTTKHQEAATTMT